MDVRGRPAATISRMAEGDEQAAAAEEQAGPRGMGESIQQDYWFDCQQNTSTGVKRLVTFAYGMVIDDRSDTAGNPKSWTDLMIEAMPAIQADVDAYGIAP